MHLTRCLVVPIVAAVLLLPRTAHAQNRSGFWGGAGVGVGMADTRCDNCGSRDQQTGPVLAGRAGWAITPQILIGAEITFWNKVVELNQPPILSETVSLYNVSAILQLYPSSTGGFFVKGGVGRSFVALDVNAPGVSLPAIDDTKVQSGPGFIAGAGYDVPVARHIAITPAVNYWAGKPGDLLTKRLSLPFAAGWKQHVLDFTINVTFP